MDLLHFLSSVRLFRKLSKPVLEELLNVLEVVHIQGGDVLMRQDDEGDCLYILLQGRLKVYQKSLSLEESFLGEIGVGDVVGEIAILSKEKRIATVHAIRDSSLLKFSQECFKTFTLKYPDVLFDITKECVTRLLHKNYKVPHGAIRTIALAPAGRAPLSKDFVIKFAKELSLRGEVLHLTSSCDRTSPGWLLEQEEKYRYVIYETDLTMTPWTQIALRQADRIIFIGEEEELSSLNVIEEIFFKEKRLVEGELVLLRKNNFLALSHSNFYLNLRPSVRYHHIRSSSDKDFSRLIRFICGEAIGLVLSGGGAQGLAHVGLIRAMEELKIPIDYVGGSSVGALIGGAAAMGMDFETIRRHCKDTLVPVTSAWDFTLPMLSLKSGERINQGCQNVYGKDFCIEDCLINFFCVSTNISHHRIEIHTKGILWEAIRASFSIPALLPPIMNQQGSLLVDGGIINNLPVDVMRSYINGGKIIAGSLSPKSHPRYDPLPPAPSGWSLFAHSLRGHKNKVPHMGDVILSSLMLGSNHHHICMEEEADYCVRYPSNNIGLMDFHLFDEIINRGYETALKQLSEFFPEFLS